MTSLDNEESTESNLGHSVTILDSILSNCNDHRFDSEKSEGTTNAPNNEELIEELRRLKSENELLKNELKCVVALYEDDSVTKSPLIQVTFKNEALAQNYKEEVEMFLHNLLSKENEEKCLEKDNKAFQLQLYQNFCIDSVPDFKDNDSESWDIPLYNNAYNDILENQNGKIEKLAFVRCFNCLGNHFLDKCPEMLDRQRIAYNRKFFFGIHHKNNLKGQIKQFKPGTISKELRNALNLKENQLPPYIYKMRILDYPPGWLKEAEVCNTELAMYDCQGKVKLYEETIQNGNDSENHEVKYDIEKIFQYPGFNIPVPEGFIDEYEEIGMPPLQSHHLIDFDATNDIAMPYIKRKFPNPSENNKRLKYDHVEEVDMDIENIDQGRIIYSDDEESHLFKFIPPLPRDTPVKVPTPPLPEDPPPIIQEAPEIEISTNFLSPTLAELEEEKQRLMNELEFEFDNTKTNISNELENINNCDKLEIIKEMSHIVLLGDYIFKNLCITTENKNWKIDIFTNDNWKLQTILEHLKSELLTLTGEEILFIHLGLNDFLSRGNNSLSEVCASYKDSLYKIRTQVKILILSAVLPFPHFDTIVNHKIQCLNMFNRELCKKANIGFINFRKAFMDNGVLNADLFENGYYYLNESGNKILLNVLLKNLEFAILKSKDVNFRPDMSCCQEVIEWFN